MIGNQTTSGTPFSRHHIPALDGLRGVAVIMVMLYHFSIHGDFNGTHFIDSFVGKLLQFGWSGVDLFFVLSGFLITGLLYDFKGRRHYFRNFYARRVLRIFPVYYVSLAAVFYLLPLAADTQSLREEQFWYWTFLLNWRIAIEGWPEEALIGHFWTLAVEEQFYLLWPWLVYMARRRTLMLVCIACIVSAPLLRWWLLTMGNDAAAWVATPARSDALAAGAFLALLIRGDQGLSGIRRWRRPGLYVSFGALAILAWTQVGQPRFGLPIMTVGFSLVALGATSILLASLEKPAASRLSRVLSNGALRYIGRVSYAMYIFHHPIGLELARAGLSVASFPTILGSQLPGFLLFLLVAGGLTLGLASLSWFLLEKPINRQKHRFPYGQDTESAPPRTDASR